MKQFLKYVSILIISVILSILAIGRYDELGVFYQYGSVEISMKLVIVVMISWLLNKIIVLINKNKQKQIHKIPVDTIVIYSAIFYVLVACELLCVSKISKTLAIENALVYLEEEYNEKFRFSYEPEYYSIILPGPSYLNDFFDKYKICVASESGIYCDVYIKNILKPGKLEYSCYDYYENYLCNKYKEQKIDIFKSTIDKYFDNVRITVHKPYIELGSLNESSKSMTFEEYVREYGIEVSVAVNKSFNTNALIENKEESNIYLDDRYDRDEILKSIRAIAKEIYVNKRYTGDYIISFEESKEYKSDFDGSYTVSIEEESNIPYIAYSRNIKVIY